MDLWQLTQALTRQRGSGTAAREWYFNSALRHIGHRENPNLATTCPASHNAAASAVASEPHGLAPLANPSVAAFFKNLTVIIEVALIQKTGSSARWGGSNKANAKCSNGQSGKG